MTNEEKEIAETSHLLENLSRDPSIPKNIRRTVSETHKLLNDKSEDIHVRLSSSIYALEEAAEDVNVPMHARTQIWAILSVLENLIE